MVYLEIKFKRGKEGNGIMRRSLYDDRGDIVANIVQNDVLYHDFREACRKLINAGFSTVAPKDEGIIDKKNLEALGRETRKERERIAKENNARKRE